MLLFFMDTEYAPRDDSQNPKTDKLRKSRRGMRGAKGGLGTCTFNSGNVSFDREKKVRVQRTPRTVALLCVCAVLTGSALAEATTFTDKVASIRKEQNLPGIAAIVVRDGKTIAEGASGVRRLGQPEPVTVDNRFAIGSLTKRMTGLMIARLVDAGKLKFESTLSELLPETPMRDEYKKVTIQQLLDFTGGIPAYERIGPKLTPQLFDLEGTLTERQAKFVRFLLQEMPSGPAGKDARYSNASYTLLGHIAATVMKKPYEVLMNELVFAPLNLDSAGWGRPWHPSRPNEPWLHMAGPEGYIAEPDRERPPEQIFMAAGGAHMSMRDLARFSQYELDARRGKDALLKLESSKRWHPNTPLSDRPSVMAGGTPALSACYALWTSKNQFMVMAVNGGSPGDEACRAVVKAVEQPSESSK
jgi:CubicO group peptidase (beta-lactamase class C family)